MYLVQALRLVGYEELCEHLPSAHASISLRYRREWMPTFGLGTSSGLHYGGDTSPINRCELKFQPRDPNGVAVLGSRVAV